MIFKGVNFSFRRTLYSKPEFYYIYGTHLKYVNHAKHIKVTPTLKGKDSLKLQETIEANKFSKIGEVEMIQIKKNANKLSSRLKPINNLDPK